MGDLILPFMAPVGPQQHETESYVSVPPALTITDETGAIWTLGFRVGAAPRGEDTDAARAALDATRDLARLDAIA